MLGRTHMVEPQKRASFSNAALARAQDGVSVRRQRKKVEWSFFFARSNLSRDPILKLAAAALNLNLSGYAGIPRRWLDCSSSTPTHSSLE